MWATYTLIAKLDSWPAVSLRLVYGIMDGLGIFAGAGQVDFIAQHRVSSHSASFVLLCFVLLLDRSLFSFLSCRLHHPFRYHSPSSSIVADQNSDIQELF